MKNKAGKQLGFGLPELCGFAYCLSTTRELATPERQWIIAQRIRGILDAEISSSTVLEQLEQAKNLVIHLGEPRFLEVNAERIQETAKRPLMRVLAQVMMVAQKVSVEERWKYFQIAGALGMQHGEAGFLLAAVETDSQLTRMEDTLGTSPRKHRRL
jgi:hypothetical protein